MQYYQANLLFKQFKKVSTFLLILCSSMIHAYELPIDHFIKHGDYLDLQLSPDGKYMAGRVRKDGTVLLYVLNTATQEVVGGVKPPKNTEIHTLTWVNDERIVFEFAQRFSQLDRPVRTGELYATNFDGSKTELLYGFRAGDNETGRRLHTKDDVRASQDIISILEDDPEHILIAEYPWAVKSIPTVSKLNVYTGRKIKVERVPYNQADILADRKGNIRFISWLDKNNDFHAATRVSKKDKWQEMDVLSGASEVGKPVQINHKGTKVYLSVKLGDKELSSLQELDLTDGSLTTLFSSPEVDISFWESDLISNEPIVGVSYPDGPEYQYVDRDSPIKAVHEKLTKAFKGQDFYITSHTDDGSKLLVNVTADTNPGEYYLFDTVTNTADFLWANLSWIDPRQMSPMQNIKLSARDGVALHGILTLPIVESEKKPALVVIPHGGPHGIRDHWEFNQEVQLLANRGYAVLQVNFRGSGGYGDTFEKMGYKQWGAAMINDIVDATNWARNEGYVARNKACIYGASYGAYAAMMASINEPDLFQCAIGYVGIYDLELLYSDGDIRDFWGGEAYLERVVGRNEKELALNSPVNYASSIKANVMLIHGTEDRRAPIKHAKVMRKALTKAGKKVEWLRFDGAGHGVYNIDKRRDLYTKLLTFLNDNLKQ